MNPWHGKSVIVTGGSRGLGRAIAAAFGAAGARVVIAARHEGQLAKTAAELVQRGYDVAARVADITRPGDVDELLGFTIQRHGRLDVLVNNAGMSSRGALVDTTSEVFRASFELNLIALAQVTRAAIPHLLETRGHVVNIGSLASKAAGRFLGPYPAAKHAVAAYSQQLRLELEPDGLHVLLVCPGPIATEQSPEERYRDQLAGLPENARRPGGGVKTRRLDPDALARDIVRACERRQRELVRPAKARLLFVLAQMSPKLGDWLVRKMT